MLFVGDPVDWLLPMPMTLVAIVVLFAVWRWLWPASRRVRNVILLGMVLWFGVAATPALVNMGLRKMEGPFLSVPDQLRALHDVDVIIVPASGSPGVNGSKATLGLEGLQRLLAAIEVWRHSGGELVLMGGLADEVQDSLSAQMRELAVSMGVPAGQISIVSASRTTWEDLSGAVHVMALRFPDAGLRHDRGADRESLRVQGADMSVVRARRPKVVLVTSALHMQRTLSTARRLGIEPVPLRSNYRQISSPSWRAWFPNNGSVWSARALLHEFVGMRVYQLLGKGQ